MTVHFIGAGPGAADLITVRGLRLIERCPVCLYAGSLVPEEILASQAHGTWNNEADGPSVWRRSVYVYRRRSLVFPFFETFDLPDQGVTAAARNVSTVPTQALTLLNNPFVVGQAELFAQRVQQAAPNDVSGQIDLIYRIALTRLPTEEEAAIARELVDARSLVDLAHVMFNLNEFLYLR